MIIEFQSFVIKIFKWKLLFEKKFSLKILVMISLSNILKFWEYKFLRLVLYKLKIKFFYWNQIQIINVRLLNVIFVTIIFNFQLLAQ